VYENNKRTGDQILHSLNNLYLWALEGIKKGEEVKNLKKENLATKSFFDKRQVSINGFGANMMRSTSI
jgi:hypothetical protein